MIIFRYLSKEVGYAVLAITGILLLIFLSNQLAHYFAQAASGKFGILMISRLIAITAPQLFGILLPLGLFLSILFIYGRLYAENEMTVLSACGLSNAKLTAFTMPITLLAVIVSGLLSLWLSPQLSAYRYKLFAESGTAIQIESTLPGRFQATEDGQKVIYVENISVDHEHMRNIFMAEIGKPKPNSLVHSTPWIIMTANGGYQAISPQTGDHFFVATNGYRYEGTPGFKNYQIAQFDQYGVRIENHLATADTQEDALPTSALWHVHKNKPYAVSELQWRFSIPLSALLLALLAIPLSRVQPRKNRYSMLLPAILIYIIYANLLLTARNWVADGTIATHWGLWWIHALLLILIGGVWIYQIGWQPLLLLFKSMRVKHA